MTTTAPPTGTWRDLLLRQVATLPVRSLGTAAVTAAYRPWSAAQGGPGVLLFGCALVLAPWAAPGVDSRFTAPSGHWRHRLARRRPTLLAGLAVLLAAVGQAPGVGGQVRGAADRVSGGERRLVDRAHGGPAPATRLRRGS
ncbi:hypothetical protein OFY01_08990, partial [Streptomyces sp. GXMU-J5]|nr:hypothetical protein [Streptomyces beihaiensis]